MLLLCVLQIFINQDPFNGTVAFISLPSVLQQSFPQYGQNPARIQFQFYANEQLFKVLLFHKFMLKNFFFCQNELVLVNICAIFNFNVTLTEQKTRTES